MFFVMLDVFNVLFEWELFLFEFFKSDGEESVSSFLSMLFVAFKIFFEYWESFLILFNGEIFQLWIIFFNRFDIFQDGFVVGLSTFL